MKNMPNLETISKMISALQQELIDNNYTPTQKAICISDDLCIEAKKYQNDVIGYCGK
jgi:hypothetical protein